MYACMHACMHACLSMCTLCMSIYTCCVDVHVPHGTQYTMAGFLSKFQNVLDPIEHLLTLVMRTPRRDLGVENSSSTNDDLSP